MFVAGIGEVEEGVPMPHRNAVGAFPVGDTPGFAGLPVEQPDVARHAAAIPLPSASVALVGCVGDPFTVAMDGGVGAVRHRHCLGHPALGPDGVDAFGSRDAAHAPGAERQSTI